MGHCGYRIKNTYVYIMFKASNILCSSVIIRLVLI